MQDNTGFYFPEGNFCGWNPPTVEWWNYQEKKSDIREGTLSALGGEIRGLLSQAGWGWMAVWSAVCSQELAPAKNSCPLAGLGQTSAGWVGGRRGKPACGRAPFTERQVAQCACVLGILVPTPPIIPVSFPPSPPPGLSNVDRPPPPHRAPDHSYNLVGWGLQSYFLVI